MTTTVLSLPTLHPSHDLSWATLPYERKGPKWFPLTPAAKAVELYMAKQYGQKFLWSTAMTSRLQIEQIMKEHYE